MTHKNMTITAILRAATLVSLGLFLSACDGGGSSSTAPNDAAGGTAAGDTDSAGAVAAEATTGSGDAAPASEPQITIHRDANGVATGEITVGNPDAVEMIEYASLTCSHCATHHIDVWPQIKKAYVDTGKLKLTFRLFARGPLDEVVTMVPLCATDQRVYPILDLMLARQDRWLKGKSGQEVLDNLAALVRRTGMSRATFDSCVRDQAILTNIRALKEIGLKDQITGTPTFILDGESFNSKSFDDFVKKIEDAL